MEIGLGCLRTLTGRESILRAMGAPQRVAWHTSLENGHLLALPTLIHAASVWQNQTWLAALFLVMEKPGNPLLLRFTRCRRLYSLVPSVHLIITLVTGFTEKRCSATTATLFLWGGLKKALGMSMIFDKLFCDQQTRQTCPDD